MRRMLLLMTLAGCGNAVGAESLHPIPPTRAVEDSDQVVHVQGVAMSPCALGGMDASPPPIHPDLEAVASQYFHASHRGGFDAYHGGPAVFPWFDVHDLEHGLTPPDGARGAASTPRTLAVVKHRGASVELGLLSRNASDLRWTGASLYPEEVVESEQDLWVLGRGGAGWHVFHRADRQTIHTGIDARSHDVRLVLAADGRPVLAWLEREGGRLSIRLAWDLDTSHALRIDELSLPEPLAELAERSSVNLAIAAHGASGVGVAWRPLTDPGYVVEHRPVTPAAAQVRWMTVTADGTVTPAHTHPTRAEVLPFTTGVGPWSLSGNGMSAHTLHRHALFVWLEGKEVVGVTADAATPVALGSSEGWPFIAFRDDTLLLFDSSPRVRAIALTCK